MENGKHDGGPSWPGCSPHPLLPRQSFWGNCVGIERRWLVPVSPRVRPAAGRSRGRAPARVCVRPQLREASCHRRDRPSVRRSVRPSVGPSVGPSVSPPPGPAKAAVPAPGWERSAGALRGGVPGRASPFASCAFSGALHRSPCGVLSPLRPGSLNLGPPRGLGGLGHCSYGNIVRVHGLGAVHGVGKVGVTKGMCCYALPPTA